jgi:hypothetical protein
MTCVFFASFSPKIPRYADLEKGMEEFDRVRAIFELAVAQETLDTPELLWKHYIDFVRNFARAMVMFVFM